MSVDIGVLAMQGDVQENVRSARQALVELGMEGSVSAVAAPAEIGGLDGLIIPGGESTTVGRMSLANGSLKAIKERVEGGMPVMGICAGLILLSSSASDRVVGNVQQPLLEVLDARIERNSFGRQNSSFEADVSMDPIGIPRFNGVFIRAPSIASTGQGVQVLSRLGDAAVAVKEGNVIGTAFHPELAGDVALHKYFASMAGSAS